MLQLIGHSPAFTPSHHSFFDEGDDPKSFKVYDVFEEEFSKISSAEVDTVVDESGHSLVFHETNEFEF